MRKLLILLLLIFGINAFAQKSFVFDYYTIYEYKNNEEAKTDCVEYTFSNSNDNTLRLLFGVRDNKFTGDARLYDYKEKYEYTFKLDGQPFEGINSLNSLLKTYQKRRRIFYAKNFAFYSTAYEIEPLEDSFVVRYLVKKRFKKNPEVSEMVFYTKPSQEIKNQIYNTYLSYALNAEHLVYDTDQIITHHYVLDPTKEKKNIRTLKEIQQTNLTINTTK
ncbi:MAG: hypothetical protein WCY89_07825 [Flavobacteriaceae bacterium]